MIILFRHDDLAQIIILTANFIRRDWSMTQALWRSPLLPLESSPTLGSPEPSSLLIGSGPRFKHDILSYLRAYGPSKTGPLIAKLEAYSFTSIRAALIASVPKRQHLAPSNSNETLFGWPALKKILSCIPVSLSPLLETEAGTPQLVIQVSSIASVGQKWLEETFFPALSSSSLTPTKSSDPPRFSLVFPTTREIGDSVTGYLAGASIHLGNQSTTQKKQLDFLRPMMCRWGGATFFDSFSASSSSKNLDEKANKKIVLWNKQNQRQRDTGRKRVAPHIKTYIRFSSSAEEEDGGSEVDWAMLTSANLSKQAWGVAVSKAGDVRICSYEIGVVVWPGLWSEDGEKAVMEPVFGRDAPVSDGRRKRGKDVCVRVGLRMPYSLPLTPYTETDRPWCKSEWFG
ncbi:MAG: hypothetical protein Q9190_005552 [Brigantiaea leucoxantha]